MRRKKLIIYISVISGVGLLLVLSTIAYILYTTLFWFGLEDRVVYSYRPVIDAIVSYYEDNDSLPSDINSLIPEYIDSLPNIKEVKSYEYNIIEQKDWELIVIAKAKGQKKGFIYRTTQKLTPEEEKKLWTECHGWFVILI